MTNIKGIDDNIQENDEILSQCRLQMRLYKEPPLTELSSMLLFRDFSVRASKTELVACLICETARQRQLGVSSRTL